MDSTWLDGYITAWQGHVRAGGPDGQDDLAALLRYMDPDVQYDDVPTGMTFTGHDGVRSMAQGAYAMSEDMAFEVVSRQCDGRSYAFEQIGRGRNTGAIGPLPGTGAAFTCVGCRSGRCRRTVSSLPIATTGTSPGSWASSG